MLVIVHCRLPTENVAATSEVKGLINILDERHPSVLSQAVPKNTELTSPYLSSSNPLCCSPAPNNAPPSPRLRQSSRLGSVAGVLDPLTEIPTCKESVENRMVPGLI